MKLIILIIPMLSVLNANRLKPFDVQLTESKLFTRYFQAILVSIVCACVSITCYVFSVIHCDPRRCISPFP